MHLSLLALSLGLLAAEPVLRFVAAPAPSDAGGKRVEERHTGQIRWVRFSADGKALLTGSNDGTARLWSARDGRRLALLAPVDDSLGAIVDAAAVAFAPDGRIATGHADRVIRIWSADGEKVLRAVPLSNAGSGVAAVAFTPDGKLLVASAWNGPIEVREVESGALVHSLALTEKEYAAHHLAISPDGASVVASTNDGTLAKWSLRDASRVKLADNALQYSGEVAFSPDGKLIAYATFEGVDVRRPDGTLVYSFAPPPSAWAVTVSSVAWTPNGKRLLAGGHSVHVIDVAKKRSREIKTKALWTIAVNRDGTRFAIAEQDGPLSIWTLPTGHR